jgi:hypothetical protein
MSDKGDSALSAQRGVEENVGKKSLFQNAIDTSWYEFVFYALKKILMR